MHRKKAVTSSDWESYSISLLEFCGDISEWKSLKEIKFLLRRKDTVGGKIQRDKSTISRHIKNVFSEGELVRESVVANFATTAADGKTYQVDYYNLDVIISVGYRVKSKRGTQFGIWVTNILKEYMRKGFLQTNS